MAVDEADRCMEISSWPVAGAGAGAGAGGGGGGDRCRW